MSLLYADSSALVRAYFVGEPYHAELRSLLFDTREPVVTSELARLELASAARAAGSSGRLAEWRAVLARIEADISEGGPIRPIALRPEVVLLTAYRIVTNYAVRTLDAIHLAVAIEDCPAIAAGAEIVFVTRDGDQARAARELGLAVS